MITTKHIPISTKWIIRLSFLYKGDSLYINICRFFLKPNGCFSHKTTEHAARPDIS